jgi:hypothetical protein
MDSSRIANRHASSAVCRPAHLSVIRTYLAGMFLPPGRAYHFALPSRYRARPSARTHRRHDSDPLCSRETIFRALLSIHAPTFALLLSAPVSFPAPLCHELA